MTDPLGRLPLGQLTLAAGAAVPDGFLAGPLIARVEAGTFDVAVGAATGPAKVGSGERVDVADGSFIVARNVGEAGGVWLVLALGQESDSWFAGAAWGAPELSPAPGLEWRLLFAEQNLWDRLLPVRVSLDRVTVAPGATLDGGVLEGLTNTRAIWLLVETGSATGRPAWSAPSGAGRVVEATPGKEVVLRAGDAGRFDLAGAREIRAGAGEPSVLLVARVADAEA